MIKKFGKIAISLLLPCIVAIGCSNAKETTPNVLENTAKPREPITLTIFNGQPGALDFDQLGITEALKTKFPYITFQVVKRGNGMDYPDLIAANTLPDIIYESASFTVDRIVTNGFHYDMQDLVKKFNFNLGRFEPNVLAQTQFANSEGKLYGFPFTMNKYALLYNKDIFDKFGVSYPKDGMTWDEVYELAKKMTRVEGEVSYQGFTAVSNNMMLNNQLSLSPLDPKEDKATVNTDGWKTLFENLKRFFEIPNTSLLATSEVTKGNIAMAVESNPLIESWAKTTPNLNWDVVSVPSLKERPKIGFKPATLALFVSQTSKYKDDAFQVVAELVSDEIQTIISKKGIGTPLTNTAVKREFGQDVPEMKGKNNNAFYYYQDAPPSPPRSASLTNVKVDFGIYFVDMINNKTDVNSELRKFEDELNQAIATAKSEKSNKQ